MEPFELFIKEMSQNRQPSEMTTDVDELLDRLEVNIATTAWNRCLKTVEQILQTLPESSDPIEAIDRLRI